LTVLDPTSIQEDEDINPTDVLQDQVSSKEGILTLLDVAGQSLTFSVNPAAEHALPSLIATVEAMYFDRTGESLSTGGLTPNLNLSLMDTSVSAVSQLPSPSVLQTSSANPMYSGPVVGVPVEESSDIERERDGESEESVTLSPRDGEREEVGMERRHTGETSPSDTLVIDYSLTGTSLEECFLRLGQVHQAGQAQVHQHGQTEMSAMHRENSAAGPRQLSPSEREVLKRHRQRQSPGVKGFLAKGVAFLGLESEGAESVETHPPHSYRSHDSFSLVERENSFSGVGARKPPSRHRRTMSAISDVSSQAEEDSWDNYDASKTEWASDSVDEADPDKYTEDMVERTLRPPTKSPRLFGALLQKMYAIDKSQSLGAASILVLPCTLLMATLLLTGMFIPWVMEQANYALSQYTDELNDICDLCHLLEAVPFVSDFITISLSLSLSLPSSRPLRV
ncbi:hypothetical protein KIPB_007700, partial [Kipferlia bialata]